MVSRKKYYLVIYIPDKEVSAIVDGIRLLADPNQKHSSHITVRGPYYNKANLPRKDQIDTWNSIVEGEEAIVDGVGTFENEKQFTLFFKANLDNIERIWWKRDFKEISPHITIINNPSLMDFSKKIYNLLSSKNISFEFCVEKLEILSTNGDSEMAFSKLKNSYDFDFLSSLVGCPLSKIEVETLSLDKRLAFIDLLVSQLKNKFHYNSDVQKTVLK